VARWDLRVAREADQAVDAQLVFAAFFVLRCV
jgi:hypothetical protein